jgi:hypothetical protein
MFGSPRFGSWKSRPLGCPLGFWRRPNLLLGRDIFRRLFAMRRSVCSVNLSLTSVLRVLSLCRSDGQKLPLYVLRLSRPLITQSLYLTVFFYKQQCDPEGLIRASKPALVAYLCHGTESSGRCLNAHRKNMERWLDREGEASFV